MTTAPETTTHETSISPDANILVLKRTLPATPERVFEAFTRPELARLWMSPGPMKVAEVELDVRVGGAYRIVMVGPAGETHIVGGVYEEIVPNEKLVYTWKWTDAEEVTQVTIELVATGTDQTELILTHEGFAEIETRDKHEEGWDGCFVKLEASVGS